MKTRILGINGSPRKSATWYSVQEALRSAQRVDGIETDFIDLCGTDIHYCIHCDRCHKEKKGRCPVFDDSMTDFYDRFQQADGYLIGSPVYNMAPSGLLQVFLNRLRPLGVFAPTGERQRKIGGAIAVGGMRNGGMETTLQAINNFYLSCGILVISGGLFAYNGAAVWSNDLKIEGAKADTQGMQSVYIMGKRVALFAKAINVGLACEPNEITPSEIMGFESPEAFNTQYGQLRARGVADSCQVRN